MAAQGDETRNEKASPFKLARAREKGQVARSAEIGFLVALAGLAAFLLSGAGTFIDGFSQRTRIALAGGMGDGSALDLGTLASGWGESMRPLVLFALVLAALLILLEVVQLGGFVWSTHPLKPDFSRLNPAQGLKRLFSMRLLMETTKTILKAAAYFGVTLIVLQRAAAGEGLSATDGPRLPAALLDAALALVLAYLVVALVFVALDQLLVRREFAKQMRMSRSELVREGKDREGDPRRKAKRRQLRAEWLAQVEGLGRLPGSDIVIANPIACAAANANLAVWRDEPVLERIADLGRRQQARLDRIARHASVRGARRLGTISAFEIEAGPTTYLSAVAPQLTGFCRDRGVLLRPLGNTVYVMPPYCINDTDLDAIYGAVEAFLL